MGKDKNSLIGIMLIIIILFTYNHFFKPLATSQTPNNQTKDQTASDTFPLPQGRVSKNSLDEALVQSQQEVVAQEVILENKDIKVTLTSRGAQVKEVLLKNYQNHQGEPLVLLDDQSSTMGFRVTANEVDIRTHELYFTTPDGDQCVTEAAIGQVAFTWSLTPDQYIKQVFSLPSQGYQLTHNWEIVGFDLDMTLGGIDFLWYDLIKRVEQDIKACRDKSTINYYLTNHDFRYLKDRSDNFEAETIQRPIQWVAIKQRFFTAGIIAEEAFINVYVALTPTLASNTTIKEAKMRLTIPNAETAKARYGKFTWYFGPNDYSTLQRVTQGFSQNLSLGWPVVKWINQYLIIPVFTWLEKYTSNYGLIIFLLVIFIKILIVPLSYSSYRSMAEMKVLQPALDAIKAKHGNDLQKAQVEQVKLYREMGINPLSGCIPLLLQLPILLAMFNFFPNAIALRQKSFLWAHDLSTYDAIMQLPFNIPYYGSHVSLFTLLMTASTLLYTWSNNQISPAQGFVHTLSYLMPLTFMFVLNTFPAGLSFYYFVSNLITFGQQALIKRLVDEKKIKQKLAKHKAKNMTGKKFRSQASLRATKPPRKKS